MAVVAGFLMSLGSAHAAPSGVSLAPGGYALVWLGAAGLFFRRRVPLAALAIGTAATASYLALGYPRGPIFVAVGWPLAMVAKLEPVRRAAVACGLSVVIVAAAELVGRASPTDLLVIGWLLFPWAVGTVLRYRGEAYARIRADEESRHAYEESRATYEERLRIARDVHDVVGHALAVINMQAGVALHVVGKQPQQAEVALTAIKRTSKDALDDLRSTLAVYRQEPGAPRRPAPGIGQLATLIAESGVDAGLTVSGDAGELPAAVDVTAYRIVQESLTNVLRHAGPARAEVLIDHRPGELVIEVTDDGLGATATGSAGHGLAGMRERVAAVRGTIEAGPRPEGGFTVRASIPVGTAP
jgi:signal transduction histidine kinase